MTRCGDRRPDPGLHPPQLVSLALPLIFGNILQQLYNTIDAMVIGRFAGETAFAAIGVAGTVMNLFLFLLSGCCTGISVLFAQQYGSRDLAGFRQEGFLASVFGGLFTLVLSLAALLLLRPLLTLMQTPEDVARLAADYLVVIFGGLLATFFYNLCAAALRSVGDTRSALLALLAAMAANLALDLLFVARLGMGIAGGGLGHGAGPAALRGAVPALSGPALSPAPGSAGRTGGWTGACSAGR